eukprot:893938-Rhodomonas_salina.2
MADRRSSDHVYEKVESFKPLPLQAQLAAMQALPPKIVESGWNPRRMQSMSSNNLQDWGSNDSVSFAEGSLKAGRNKRRWNPLKTLWRMIPACRSDPLPACLSLQCAAQC